MILNIMFLKDTKCSICGVLGLCGLVVYILTHVQEIPGSIPKNSFYLKKIISEGLFIQNSEVYVCLL